MKRLPILLITLLFVPSYLFAQDSISHFPNSLLTCSADEHVLTNKYGVRSGSLKVIGKIDDGCSYVETYPGSSVKCIFQKEEQKIMYLYFKNLLGNKHNFENLQNFMERVSEIKSNRCIFIDQRKDKVAATDAISSLFRDNVNSKKDPNEVLVKSIFFGNNDLEKIINEFKVSHGAYKRLAVARDYQKVCVDEVRLDAIIYRSSTNWTIWINGQANSYANANPNVTNVYYDAVTFSCPVDNIALQGGGNSLSLLPRGGGMIKFRLQPGQSFIMKSMKVVPSNLKVARR